MEDTYPYAIKFALSEKNNLTCSFTGLTATNGADAVTACSQRACN